MSKIGRKPIAIGDTRVEIIEGGRESSSKSDVKNTISEVRYSGKHGTGVHILPSELEGKLDNGTLTLRVRPDYAKQRDINMIWGLHRALLANKIRGASVLFERQLEIVGLGFKAEVTGSKVTFTLGYSHPVYYELPEGISLQIDKTKRILTFSSNDKELLGQVSSVVRALRKPEPYKGKGIKYSDEVIVLKEGKKARSAA